MDNERLIRVEESTKQAHKRLDTNESEIKELRDVYRALTQVSGKVENVEKDVSEIKIDLKEIKEKPGKRWEDLTKTIITCIATAIAGYFLAKLGVK